MIIFILVLSKKLKIFSKIECSRMFFYFFKKTFFKKTFFKFMNQKFYCTLCDFAVQDYFKHCKGEKHFFNQEVYLLKEVYTISQEQHINEARSKLILESLVRERFKYNLSIQLKLIEKIRNFQTYL